MLQIVLVGAMLKFQKPETSHFPSAIDADKRRRMPRKIERGWLIGCALFRQRPPAKKPQAVAPLAISQGATTSGFNTKQIRYSNSTKEP